jgi:endonuclease/exonuclease/phosphatase family metal-dependent hydrolase
MIPSAPVSPEPLSLQRLRTAVGASLFTVFLWVGAGCVTIQNYPDPGGPRYGGEGVERAPEAPAPVVVQVATFNIRYGEETETALEVIRANPGLMDADFLLLQEVDAEGTEWIATELGLAWVYYPATRRNGKDFGNAVLSRWPLEDERKVILPHPGVFNGSRRIATAVTARVGDTRLRVYSVHLETPVSQGRTEREEQLLAVLEDAEPYPHVIIGGDLNSGSIAQLAVDAGYLWPTQDGPRTAWFSRVDHILYRGLVPLWGETSGTVTEVAGASDHLPVWALGRVR